LFYTTKFDMFAFMATLVAWCALFLRLVGLTWVATTSLIPRPVFVHLAWFCHVSWSLFVFGVQLASLLRYYLAALTFLAGVIYLARRSWLVRRLLAFAIHLAVTFLLGYVCISDVQEHTQRDSFWSSLLDRRLSDVPDMWMTCFPWLASTLMMHIFFRLWQSLAFVCRFCYDWCYMRVAVSPITLESLAVHFANATAIVEHKGVSCLTAVVNEQMVYLALPPLLASKLRQSARASGLGASTNEAMVPGSIMYPLSKVPHGIVYVYAAGSHVGMGFVVTVKGRPTFVTACHVMDAAKTLGNIVLVSGADSTKAVKMGSWKSFVVSKTKSLDVFSCFLPAPVVSHLAIKSLKMNTMFNPDAAIKVFGSPSAGGAAVSTGIALYKDQPFVLGHTASTVPAYSGTPIMLGNSVVGMHTGTRSEGAYVENVGVAVPFLFSV